MRLREISFVIGMFIPFFLHAQIAYVDPTTTAAVTLHSTMLRSGQNKIADEQNALKNAQITVSGIMAVANDIQNKVYKGLSEVSGTLTNGFQVKNIFAELEGCRRYSSEISRLVRRNPKYAVFGASSSQKIYQKIVEIGSEVSSVIASRGNNLMTAGDRYRLLDSIETKLRSLKIWLITMQLALENAERAGFWRSINPFQGYINTDKGIIENIMRRFKHQW